MTRSKLSESGFLLIEIIVIAAILVSLPLFVRNCNFGNTRAREAETKANLHTIQIALERYATDHSGTYPPFILGGDVRGWDLHNGNAAVSLPSSDLERPIHDPLIHYAYMYSYPQNAFIERGRGVGTQGLLTSGTTEMGQGDVRFGWTSEIMGNLLDDPRYLFDGQGNPSRLQYTMLSKPEENIGVLVEGRYNSFYVMGGYPSGWEGCGNFPTEDGVAKFWWPGNFYYRSAGDFFVNESEITNDIWGWPYIRVNRYILGGYGDRRTIGMDVLRLTSISGSPAALMPGAYEGVIEGEYYQDHSNPDRPASHPDFDIRVGYSNPEVFGGGERDLMPQFPYYESGTNAWIYGAPDGYKDGIIIVLTSGTDRPGY